MFWVSMTLLSFLALGCEVEDGYRGTLEDIDGNTYKTVRIGDQVWMAENLKAKRYQNETDIPDIMAYSDDEANVEIYGRLYTFNAATSEGVTDKKGFVQGACPKGFHIPTDDEWKQLETFLGMTGSDVNLMAWRGSVEGGMLKTTGTEHWTAPNAEATNTTGFSALPGGNYNPAIGYASKGLIAYFWSCSSIDDYEKWSRVLQTGNGKIGRYPSGKDLGFSVRCVKN